MLARVEADGHPAGPADRITFHLIGDALSFSGLSNYGAMWAFGSVHHVPFRIAREECLNALQHLKLGAVDGADLPSRALA